VNDPLPKKDALPRLFSHHLLYPGESFPRTEDIWLNSTRDRENPRRFAGIIPFLSFLDITGLSGQHLALSDQVDYNGKPGEGQAYPILFP
jgi:hypothetical protein